MTQVTRKYNRLSGIDFYYLDEFGLQPAHELLGISVVREPGSITGSMIFLHDTWPSWMASGYVHRLVLRAYDEVNDISAQLRLLEVKMKPGTNIYTAGQWNPWTKEGTEGWAKPPVGEK